MEKKRFCIDYLYKGTLTEYHKQRYQKFVETEEKMVEFLEKMDSHPNNYFLKNVYLADLTRIKDKDVNNYIKTHRDIEEYKQKQRADSIKRAYEKINSVLTDDEIDILKAEGALQ